MKTRGKTTSAVLCILFVIVMSYVDLSSSPEDIHQYKKELPYSLAPPTNSTCFTCHTNLTGILGNRIAIPANDWKQSVHFSNKALLMCTTCHGGNSSSLIISDAKSVESGYNRNMTDDYSVDNCGKCHENELYAFKNGIHWLSGTMEDRITCMDCHGGHNIKPSADPESSTNIRNIPKTCGSCHTDEYNSYFQSFHGKNFLLDNNEVAVCSDCHNSHYILPQSDVNSSTHESNLGRVCSFCHMNNPDLEVTEGLFHDNQGAHTPNLMLDKSEVSSNHIPYFLGPLDLAFYIPFVYNLIIALFVFTIITLILFETVIHKVFRRGKHD